MPDASDARAEVKMYSDYKSPYAFLAYEPAFALENNYRIRVRWIPFQLRIKGKGERSQYSEWKARYSYLDVRRFAAPRGIVIRGPLKVYDTRPALIGGLFAERHARLHEFSRLAYERFFQRAFEADEPEAVAALVGEIGLAPEEYRAYLAGEGGADYERAQADGHVGRCVRDGHRGEFDLAQAELDAVTVPTNTPESMQLAGALALCRSVVASADSRPGDMDAPLELAAELAERTGEATAYWLGFGLHAVGQWHMFAAREAGDHERVVSIAEALRPDVHAARSVQADYWVSYGRALSKLRGRSEDAVRAFRRAEVISPHHVHRDPFVPEALAGLLTRTRRDSPAGRELRRMAYRAGLPV